MKVFVYGTLKRNNSNNYLLKTARFACEAFSRDKYVLYSGGYPLAVHESRNEREELALPIIGEIYEGVDRTTLQRLDGLEGHPNFYQRFLRTFNLGNGAEDKAFIYEYPHNLTYRLSEVVEINNQQYYRWNYDYS